MLFLWVCRLQYCSFSSVVQWWKMGGFVRGGRIQYNVWRIQYNVSMIQYTLPNHHLSLKLHQLFPTNSRTKPLISNIYIRGLLPDGPFVIMQISTTMPTTLILSPHIGSPPKQSYNHHNNKVMTNKHEEHVRRSNHEKNTFTPTQSITRSESTHHSPSCIPCFHSQPLLTTQHYLRPTLMRYAAFHSPFTDQNPTRAVVHFHHSSNPTFNPFNPPFIKSDLILRSFKAT